ncbi:MAG: hypothetical protein ACI9K8_001280, partial [Reinekea sp.]
RPLTPSSSQPTYVACTVVDDTFINNFNLLALIPRYFGSFKPSA